MKKYSVLMLLGLLCVTLLGGCGKEEVAEETTLELSFVEVEEVVMEEEEEEVVDLHEGEAKSDLTGEWIDEAIAANRPVALMMGNTKDATPQYGIGSADLVYEAPVEGSLTRLLCFFQDYESVEKIMSVRSCRLYYIDWALEFDAVYIHYGQAYLAKSMLAQSYVNNLSGLDGALNSMFYRDDNKSAPHNAYVTGASIASGIEIKGYTATHDESYESHYVFAEDDEEVVLDGTAAAVVTPGYSINAPWFVYDEETGLYARYQYGAAQVDASTNEQVTVKNILLQICDWSVADSDKGYLDVETVGSGSGYYVTGGSAIAVTWKKDSQTSATRYYDENGEEIVLNQGKTWVCIIQDTYAERITFSAGEDE